MLYGICEYHQRTPNLGVRQLLGTSRTGLKQIRIFVTGSQKNMCPVKNRVVVKDIGTFIPAICTESRGGYNGDIPGPQNLKNQTQNLKNSESDGFKA